MKGTIMLLCVYTFAVSVIYTILWIVSDDAANATIVFFIALLLFPSIYSEWKRTHGKAGR